MKLTTAARELHELKDTLATHKATAAQEEKRLCSEIYKRELILGMSEDGLDLAKVALAKTILRITDYSQGGSDRNSCRQDAIKQLSTGKRLGPYTDLWYCCFSTKNYSQWRGQREDHEYGCGPRHGSICFSIGLTAQTRKRLQVDLTADEVEAAIYYLVNLERIQIAEAKAHTKASA